MKRTLRTTGVLITAGPALALCERTMAVETASGPQPLDLRHAALFKNGLGFFVGQLECADGKTSFDVALPTAPSRGTFWVSYPSELPLAGIVARQVESGQTLAGRSKGYLGHHRRRFTALHRPVYARQRKMAEPYSKDVLYRAGASPLSPSSSAPAAKSAGAASRGQPGPARGRKPVGTGKTPQEHRGPERGPCAGSLAQQQNPVFRCRVHPHYLNSHRPPACPAH